MKRNNSEPQENVSWEKRRAFAKSFGSKNLLSSRSFLKKEFISTFAYYSSISHTDAIINNYLGEVKSVFKKIKENFDILEKLLEGAVCHAGFKRLT